MVRNGIVGNNDADYGDVAQSGEAAESHTMELFTQDDEGSFLYRTANDDIPNDIQNLSFAPWAADTVEIINDWIFNPDSSPTAAPQTFSYYASVSYR